MRARLFAALCLASPGMAQDAEVEAVPQLRAAFAALDLAEPVFAVAVVGDAEPSILCRGKDGAGAAITAQSLFPLGPLVRILAADALHVRTRGKLDVASGVTLGERELTVRALLEGIDTLPDYFAWDGSEPVDPAVVLRCSEAVTAGGAYLTRSHAGMAELLLLEGFALDGRTRSWADLLRTSLGPLAGSFAPLAADALDEASAAQLGAAAKVIARAEPQALRLVASGRDLAAWLQWRLRHAMPEWSGARAGAKSTTDLHDGQEAWRFAVDRGPVRCSLRAYGDPRAALLILGCPSGPAAALARAFEEDLFGPPATTRQRLGGLATINLRLTLAPLAGTWEVPDGRGASCRLVVSDRAARSLRLEWQRVACGLRNLAAAMGTYYCVDLADNEDGVGGRLVLVPFLDAKPPRMTAILVETHADQAALPRCFELVRKED
jgi:hypothetical protein